MTSGRCSLDRARWPACRRRRCRRAGPGSGRSAGLGRTARPGARPRRGAGGSDPGGHRPERLPRGDRPRRTVGDAGLRATSTPVAAGRQRRRARGRRRAARPRARRPRRIDAARPAGQPQRVRSGPAAGRLAGRGLLEDRGERHERALAGRTRRRIGLVTSRPVSGSCAATPARAGRRTRRGPRAGQPGVDDREPARREELGHRLEDAPLRVRARAGSGSSSGRGSRAGSRVRLAGGRVERHRACRPRRARAWTRPPDPRGLPGRGRGRASPGRGRRRPRRSPAAASGTAIRPVPTASSTIGPPVRCRERQVEVDVAGIVGEVEVVQPREGVAPRSRSQRSRRHARRSLRRRLAAVPSGRARPSRRLTASAEMASRAQRFAIIAVDSAQSYGGETSTMSMPARSTAADDPADGPEQLAREHPARLGRAGAGRRAGIDDVDVDREVDRVRRRRAPRRSRRR